MKTLLLLLGIGISAVTSAESYETLNCEVVPLEEYGFEQQSEYDEYVCVNPGDYTDFVIVVDEFNEHGLGDNLTVELNEYGEVVETIVNEEVDPLTELFDEFEQDLKDDGVAYEKVTDDGSIELNISYE